MPAKVKNYTFALPTEVVEKLREYARNEDIPSLNAGVREAIEEYTVKIERERFRREMQEAAADEIFLADVKEAGRDFAAIDAEAAGRVAE